MRGPSRGVSIICVYIIFITCLKSVQHLPWVVWYLIVTAKKTPATPPLGCQRGPDLGCQRKSRVRIHAQRFARRQPGPDLRSGHAPQVLSSRIRRTKDNMGFPVFRYKRTSFLPPYSSLLFPSSKARRIYGGPLILRGLSPESARSHCFFK